MNRLFLSTEKAAQRPAKRNENSCAGLNEIAGMGNHNTALFWEYDTRTGRRWNRDPVIKPWESGYATMSNTPIWHNDVLGNLDDKQNAANPNKDRHEAVATSRSKEVVPLQRSHELSSITVHPSLQQKAAALQKAKNEWLENEQAVNLEQMEHGNEYYEPKYHHTKPPAGVDANENMDFRGRVKAGLGMMSPAMYTSAPQLAVTKAAPLNWVDKEGNLLQVAVNGANKVPRTTSVLGHIFRNETGHVNPSTVTEQNQYINTFEQVANNPQNLNPNVLSNYQRQNMAQGFQGYSQTMADGTQIWVQARNGDIFNAGVNAAGSHQ